MPTSSLALRLKRKREACDDASKNRRGDSHVSALPVAIAQNSEVVMQLLKSMGLQERVHDVIKLVDGSRRRTTKRVEDVVHQSEEDPGSDIFVEQMMSVFDSKADKAQSKCLCSAMERVEYTVTRDGDMVCTRCGVVIGLVREQTPWTNLPKADESRKRSISVPAAVWKRANAPTSEVRRQTHIETEVAHWAHYANVHGADLERAKVHAVRIANDTVGTVEMAVAAALVAIHVPHIDRDAVERAMRECRALPQTSTHGIPAPSFACKRCGCMRHTAKSARYHCR